MFDIIYIEKSLCDKEPPAQSDENTNRLDFMWIQEFQKQKTDGKIKYVESFEMDFRNSREGFEKTELVELTNGKRAVLIGETKRFLEQGNVINLPVLAVLTKEDEDLFSFPYAVGSLSDITLDYLELIQCRFEKRPYIIAETERLRIMEMNEASAVKYFLLKEAEPELFLQATSDVVNSKQEIEEISRAYIAHSYPFYGYGIWAVYEKVSHCLVGFAGVEKLASEADMDGDEQDFLNFSYYIIEKYRCNGYATECCRAIVDYMKEEFGEKTLRCVIEAHNYASLAVAGKLDVEICKI